MVSRKCKKAFYQGFDSRKVIDATYINGIHLDDPIIDETRHSVTVAQLSGLLSTHSRSHTMHSKVQFLQCFMDPSHNYLARAIPRYCLSALQDPILAYGLISHPALMLDEYVLAEELRWGKALGQLDYGPWGEVIGRLRHHQHSRILVFQVSFCKPSAKVQRCALG